MVKSEIYILPDLKCPNAVSDDYQNNKRLRKHSCCRCRKLFKSYKCTITHFRKFHKNGINVCFMCKKYFYRINWLYNHEKKCKNKFTHDKQFHCDICDKEYSYNEFPNHILTHLGVTSYYCELCFEHCISKTQFEEHCLSHKQIDTSTHLSSAVHACDLCPSMFNHLTDLSFHYVSHVKKMPYSCNICSFAFFDDKDRVIHSHLHKAGRMKCDLCNVKFENKLECLLHVVTHNSSKFFRNFFYINREDVFSKQNFEKITAFYHSVKIIKTKDDLEGFFDSFVYDSLLFKPNAAVDSVLEYSKAEAEKSETNTDYVKSNSNTSSIKQSLPDGEVVLNGLQCLQNTNNHVNHEKTTVLHIKSEEGTYTEDLMETNIADLPIKTEPICCLEILDSELIVSENNAAEISADSYAYSTFLEDSQFNDCNIASNELDLNCDLIKEEIICENLESDASLEEPGKIINPFDENNSCLRPHKMSFSKTVNDSFSQIVLKKPIVKLHRLPQEVCVDFSQKIPVAIEDNLNYVKRRMQISKFTVCNSGDYQSKLDGKNGHSDVLSKSLLNRTYTKSTSTLFQRNDSVFPSSFNASNLSLSHKKNKAAANYSSLIRLPKLSSLENTSKATCDSKCKQNIYGKPMCNHKCFTAANVSLPHKTNDSISSYSPLINSSKLSMLEQALRTKCNGTCERNIYGKPMCNHAPDKVLISNLFGLRTNAVNISPVISNQVLVKSRNTVNQGIAISKTQTLIPSKDKALGNNNVNSHLRKIPTNDKSASFLASSLNENKSNLQPSSGNSFIKCVVLPGKNSLGLMQKKSIVENSSCINVSKSATMDSKLIKNASTNVHDQTRTQVDKLVLKKNNNAPPTQRSVKSTHFLRPKPLATKKFSPEKERKKPRLAKKQIEPIKLINNTCESASLAKRQIEQVKLINNTRGSGLPVIQTVGSVISLDGDKANEGKRSYQIYTPYSKKTKDSSILSQKVAGSIKNVNFPVKSKLIVETPTFEQSKINSSIPTELPGRNTNSRLLFAMIKRPYESSLRLENVEKMRAIQGLLK